MTKTIFTAAALMAALLAAPVAATPVSYDEAVSGDIGGGTNFTFGFGTNVISGRVSAQGSSFGEDFDFFNASLPTGAIFESFSVTLTNNPAGSGSFPGRFEIFYGNTFTGTAVVTSTGGTFTQTIGSTVLSDRIRAVGFNDFTTGMAADYRIEITLSDPDAASVNVVPLPAGAPLLLAGLAGLAVLRRRRRAA